MKKLVVVVAAATAVFGVAAPVQALGLGTLIQAATGVPVSAPAPARTTNHSPDWMVDDQDSIQGASQGQSALNGSSTMNSIRGDGNQMVIHQHRYYGTTQQQGQTQYRR